MNDIGVTATEAAAQVGVRPKTVYTWVDRGWLTPIPGTKPYRFWLGDVFAAEKARRVHWKQRKPC